MAVIAVARLLLPSTFSHARNVLHCVDAHKEHLNRSLNVAQKFFCNPTKPQTDTLF